MPAKLKPYPFCGGKADVLILIKARCFFLDAGLRLRRQELLYQVVCHTCGALTQLMDIKQEAIKAWNRRIKDDEHR